MNDKPMKVLQGDQDIAYAELCVLLPADWNINAKSYALMEEVFSDENNYWPVRWLKKLQGFHMNTIPG